MQRSASSPSILLLTGSPGVGKTTVVRRVAAGLPGRHIGGFYTEEIRVHGIRQGFRLVGFQGDETVIAHVAFSHRQRVGQYGVDVPALDLAVAEALDVACDLYIVDEIGKMECLSAAFVQHMRRLLDAGGPLLATIAAKGGGFMDEVRRRHEAQLWQVSRENRERLPAQVLERVRRW